MRILSVVGKQYYGRPDAVEPMYLEFTDPLRTLGYSVEHFDHALMRLRFGLGGCGQRFVDRCGQAPTTWCSTRRLGKTGWSVKPL